MDHQPGTNFRGLPPASVRPNLQMTSSLKPALLAALVLLLAAGLGGCRREPEFARVDAALAPLIPPDAEAIACVRLDRIRRTPYHAQLIEARKIPALERFAEQTGLDIRKDVWELLLVWPAGDGAPLILIRGKFGGSFGLEPEFDRPGLQRMSYKGYYIIYGDGPAVLFMNTGAAIAGRIDDLKKIIDRRDEPGWKSNQELIDLAGTLPGPTPFWLAARNGRALIARLAGSGLLSAGEPLAAGIGPLTMHTSLDDGMTLTFRAGYPTANAARQTAVTARALVELARARLAPNDPGLAAVFNGVRISKRETELEVNIRVVAEAAESLLGLLPGLRQPD